MHYKVITSETLYAILYHKIIQLKTHRRDRNNKMNISKKDLLICLIVLIFIWELVTRFFMFGNGLLPRFSDIIFCLIQEIRNNTLLIVTVISLRILLIGYVISIISSLVISILCMKIYFINVLFSTLYTILNPLPSVAILPIVLLFFGLNEKSIIILIFHAVFWPMLAYIKIGFTTISPILEDFVSNINLPLIYIYVMIYIPSSLPHIITGLRTSWGRAWRSLISAEAIFGVSGATQGLGYYIYYNRAFANMPNVFAGIIVISVISIIIEGLFKIIEDRTIKRWGMIK